MNLSEQQSELVATAESLIREFVEKRDAFALFSLVMYPSGEIRALQPTAQFPDSKTALMETLGVLFPMAKSGQIVACIICTPVQDGDAKLAILDVESQGGGRTIGVLPYKKLSDGWTFGEKEFTRDVPRAFAT